MSSVTLVGNITKTPELLLTNSGLYYLRFTIAVNRRWQNRQTQEWEESTSYFDVVCWRELAENVAQSIRRGDRIVVVGRLEQRSWETPEGERRSKIEVTADEVGPSLRWATAQVEKNAPANAGPTVVAVPAATTVPKNGRAAPKAAAHTVASRQAQVAQVVVQEPEPEPPYYDELLDEPF